MYRLLLIFSLILLILRCSDNVTDSTEGGDESLNSMWGINCHLPDDKTITLIDSCGIDWVRLSISWAQIEVDSGVIYWDYIDDRVAAVKEAGLHIMMTVSETPQWASEGGQVNDIPSDTTFWRDFMYLTVNRYKDDIEYWGIWNEPNGGDQEYFEGTPEQFRDNILIPGAHGAKDADPGCNIIAPGVTIHTNWSEWMIGIFNVEAIELVDIVAVHLYVTGDADDFFWNVDYRTEYLDDILPLENVLRNLGIDNKPVWLEETGWPTSGPYAVDEATQAERYHELLWGIYQRDTFNKIFPYEIIDDELSDEISSGFGLVRSDYTPRSSYSVYHDFIAEPTEP